MPGPEEAIPPRRQPHWLSRRAVGRRARLAAAAAAAPLRAPARPPLRAVWAGLGRRGLARAAPSALHLQLRAAARNCGAAARRPRSRVGGAGGRAAAGGERSPVEQGGGARAGLARGKAARRRRRRRARLGSRRDARRGLGTATSLPLGRLGRRQGKLPPRKGWAGRRQPRLASPRLSLALVAPLPLVSARIASRAPAGPWLCGVHVRVQAAAGGGGRRGVRAAAAPPLPARLALGAQLSRAPGGFGAEEHLVRKAPPRGAPSPSSPGASRLQSGCNNVSLCLPAETEPRSSRSLSLLPPPRLATGSLADPKKKNPREEEFRQGGRWWGEPIAAWAGAEGEPPGQTRVSLRGWASRRGTPRRPPVPFGGSEPSKHCLLGRSLCKIASPRRGGGFILRMEELLPESCPDFHLAHMAWPKCGSCSAGTRTRGGPPAGPCRMERSRSPWSLRSGQQSLGNLGLFPLHVGLNSAHL